MQKQLTSYKSIEKLLQKYCKSQKKPKRKKLAKRWGSSIKNTLSTIGEKLLHYKLRDTYIRSPFSSTLFKKGLKRISIHLCQEWNSFILLFEFTWIWRNLCEFTCDINPNNWSRTVNQRKASILRGKKLNSLNLLWEFLL